MQASEILTRAEAIVEAKAVAQNRKVESNSEAWQAGFIHTKFVSGANIKLAEIRQFHTEAKLLCIITWVGDLSGTKQIEVVR